MKTLQNFDVKGKRVLVRCDFNVPLGDQGEILDDFRIKETIPTIEYLLKEGAKIILMSHLGRPEGKVVEELRLTPIQERLTEYLGLKVLKTEDCLAGEIEELTKKMESGEVLLLENLRFHKEEEENDAAFAKGLAKLGDIYINDAFGASHRTHASIVGVPKYLPSAAGLLLEKEINVLTKLGTNPERPLVAIIGGAKAEKKSKLIDKLSRVADFILIGGILQREIKEKNIKLESPQKIIEPVDEIGGGMDIGPKTVALFKEKISQAKTVFWNGPLGMVEKEEFARGTKAIFQAIIDAGSFSVLGGGETVALFQKLGLTEKFNHVSTGGGAMLEFLSGKKLPGIEALNSRSGN